MGEFNKHARNSRLLAKFLITYVVMILLIILSMFPIYSALLDNASENIMQDAVYFSETNFDSFFTELDNLWRESNALYSDSTLMNLRRYSPEQPPYYYHLMLAQQRVNEVFIYSSLLREVVVSYPDRNYVFTRGNVFPTRAQFYDMVDLQPRPQESWLDQFYGSGSGMREFRELHIEMTTGCREVIGVPLRLPISSADRCNMSVLLLIDKEQLVNTLLSDNVKDYSFFYWTDKTGSISVRYRFEGDALAENTRGEPPRTARIGTEDYSVRVIHNEYDDTRLVLGISKRYIHDAYREVRMLILKYIVLALLIGGVMALFFSLRSFRPLNRTLNVIRSADLPVPQTPPRDEIKAIESAFVQMAENYGSYRESYNRLDAALKNNLLEKLMIQGVYSAANLALCRQYFPHIPPLYTVGVFTFFTLENEYLPSGEESRKLGASLISLLEKEVAETALIYPAVNNNIYALFRDNEGLASHLSVLLERVCAGQLFTIKAGLSGPMSGLEHIAQASGRAKGTLTAHYHQRGRHVFSGQRPADRALALVNVSMLDKLQSLVLGGDGEGAAKMIESVVQQLETSSLSVPNLQQLFFTFRTVYETALEKLGPSPDGQGAALPEGLEEYSIHRVVQAVREMNRAACALAGLRKSRGNDTLRQNLLRYIDRSFTDANLCAASIAAEFGISEKYAFRLVREASGQTLNDYITALRVRTAADQLAHTAKPVRRIAEEAGFNSSNTFYKVFQRALGVSPTDYRRSSRPSPDGADSADNADGSDGRK